MDPLRRRNGGRAQASIELLAQQFRDRYAPGVIGPLELDSIVEFDLGMDILPRSGMLLHTGKPGWLACDGRTIVVDEGFQRDQPREYQSLLAHEVAHAKLHRRYLPKVPITNAEEFRDFHAGMSDELVATVEWQAREMGLHIQMPQREFAPLGTHLVELAKDRFPMLNGAAEMFVQAHLADHFGVSEMRAGYRMQKLWRDAQRADRIDRQARRWRATDWRDGHRAPESRM